MPSRLIAMLATAIAVGAPSVTAETEFTGTGGPLTIPARSTLPGKKFRWSGCVRANATHSTDTLNVKVKAGPSSTAIGSLTTIGASGAVDVADNDVVTWDIEVDCQSATNLLFHGFLSAPGAEGTATVREVFERVTLDNTVDNRFTVSTTWSVADAGNASTLEAHSVSEFD